MQGPKDFLELGAWNAYCDSCKFKFKSHELKRDWKGLMKCPTCFETRHPMDLQKPPRESKPIPWSRPNDFDSYVAVTIDPLVQTEGGSVPTGTFTTNNETL